MGRKIGYKEPIEMKEKRLNKIRGSKRTPEQIENIRKSCLGRPTWNKGIKGKDSHSFGKHSNLGKNWYWFNREDRSKLRTDEDKSYDTKYKYWMFSIKKRDNFKCKINNKDCKGRLEAHHILGWKSYPELRYEINNGITLCLAHHPRSREEEAKLSPYFKKLVAEIK